LAAAVNSTNSALPRESEEDMPPGAQRFRRRQRGLQAFDVAFGAPPEHLDEQVVDRPEVVVQLQPGLGLDPPGRHGCVPVTEHDPLGGVEKGALLRGSGSGLPALGRAWSCSTDRSLP
jgi:hypothetical protein